MRYGCSPGQFETPDALWGVGHVNTNPDSSPVHSVSPRYSHSEMEKEKDERRPMQTLPSAPELVSCLSSHIKCTVPDCFMQSADLQKERENYSLEDSLKRCHF